MLALLIAAAQAQDVDLAALAARDGLPAAAQALQAIVDGAKSPKKRDKALAAARLDQVALPAKAAFGAELELTAVNPLTSCRWDGGLTCLVSATGAGPIDPTAFQLRCRSRYGATAEIAATPAVPAGPSAAWVVTGAEACWALNGATVLILPVAHADLEGIGTGDDDQIAPELTGLTRDQVEAAIVAQMSAFKACTTRDDGPVATGKLVVGYHIGPDGRFDRVEAESSALNSPAAEACILERFGRIALPPPNDGFTEGSYPFTFQ